MFAYCGNNPVAAVDPDGHMCVPANISRTMTDSGDHGGGVDGNTGGGGAIAGFFGLIVLIVKIFTPSRYPFPDTWNQGANAQALPQSQAQSIAIADEKVDEDTMQQACFFGCIAHKYAPLIYVTGAMTFEEAYVWAMATERFTEFGKGRNWGLYTVNETDAFAMALALGNGLPPIRETQNPGSGMNNHYHVYGHDFQAYFRHFHVWFGGPQ